MDGWQVDADSEDIVGANEEYLYLQGDFFPPDPEVGIMRWTFEHTDIVNEHGISVLDLIEDEEWITTACEYIAQNYNPTMQ
jgi:hypothetical protein